MIAYEHICKRARSVVDIVEEPKGITSETLQAMREEDNTVSY